MQVLLQLASAVWFAGSPAAVSGSPGDGLLSLPTWPAAVSPPLPGGYSGAICSMWSLSSLYCSGKERDKGSGRLLNHPVHAPSPQNPGKGLHIPRALSPLPSSKLPMVACFFRKSLQSFLLRPNASMLWMKVLREDRDALGERMARLPLLPHTFLSLSAAPCSRHRDDAQLSAFGFSTEGTGAGPREKHQGCSAPLGMSPEGEQLGGVPRGGAHALLTPAARR